MNCDMDWKIIYEVIARCSQEHTPKGLAVAIVENIEHICAFDQALAYLFDSRGKVCDQYLKRVSDQYSALYLNYYMNTDNARYSCYKEYHEGGEHPLVKVFSWADEVSAEFVPNFIRPNGLKYSSAFVLYDLNGNYRAFISLDRKRSTPFNEGELVRLRYIIPVMNNFHKNFYYEESQREAFYSKIWQEGGLTKREIEIANLLCQGASPASISRMLFIAQKTTYHHISNIYKKLHVSSNQELLVRLLRG